MARRKPPRPDVSVHDHGTIALIVPETDAARTWCANNLGPDVIRYGDGIACEPRYLAPIVEGLQADGLNVEGI
jgi:hypothetical protein